MHSQIHGQIHAKGELPMALFSGPGTGHDIHRDVEALRREVAALSRIAAKRVIRRRAHDLEETIRDNPARTAAAIGLAALAIAAAALLLGNRR
jgi:hypothetical protein